MPKDPTGSVVRNLFLIQRLGNGVNADVETLIRSLFDDIVAQLARIDPTSPKAERWQRQRVEKLLGVVQGDATKTFAEVHKTVRQQLAEIGVHQGKWAADTLAATVGAGFDIRPGQIGVNMMKAIVDTDFVQGALLSDWFKQQGAGVPRRVAQQIRIGMAQNETLDDIVRRIRGRSAGKRGVYQGGVMQTTTREAEAVVRTAVNQIANTAHMETYKANSDITTTYEWVSTLDNRTSPICQARDGEVFKYDDPGAPVPPAHWQCRSSTIPRVDWEALGIEPPAEGTRASAGGQVKASTNYEGWLREQPESVRREILGPSRMALFDDHKVSLKDMVRRDGSVVRVSDLSDAG